MRPVMCRGKWGLTDGEMAWKGQSLILGLGGWEGGSGGAVGGV